MTTAALPRVTVRVQLFASYAEWLGVKSLELTLDHPASVGKVIRRIRSLPGGEKLPAQPLCAVNLRQANLEDPIASGDEVALLPPMAGG